MEFIGWSLVFVVPAVYLIIALAQVQAASFAAVSAVDAASRILEVEPGQTAVSHAQMAAGLALSDQGITEDPAEALSITCGDAACGAALVRVEVGVDLPLISAAGIGRDIIVMDAQRMVTLATSED